MVLERVGMMVRDQQWARRVALVVLDRAPEEQIPGKRYPETTSALMRAARAVLEAEGFVERQPAQEVTGDGK